MSKNNIIEINGKRYDARSGAVLSHGHAVVPKIHAKPAAPATHHPKPAAKKPTMHDVVRQPAKATGRKPHTTHTLMRKAVKKPVATTRPHSRAQGSTDHLAKRNVALAPKKSAKQVDHQRLQKASRVAKSQLISHFAPLTAHMPQLALNPPEPLFTPPAPDAHQVTVRRAAPKAKHPKTTADILERALQAASSHEQPEPKRVRKARKRATILTASALSVLVIGVIGSQQMPAAKLKMASSQAGFSVDVPDYTPAGYSMSKIVTQPGLATAEFDSNSDDRTFRIIQKPSKLDSVGLRDGFVAQTDQNYRTVEAAGRTIFMYGNNNATWATGGVWYQVETEGVLSSRQLVQLATTL